MHGAARTAAFLLVVTRLASISFSPECTGCGPSTMLGRVTSGRGQHRVWSLVLALGPQICHFALAPAVLHCSNNWPLPVPLGSSSFVSLDISSAGESCMALLTPSGQGRLILQGFRKRHQRDIMVRPWDYPCNLTAIAGSCYCTRAERCILPGSFQCLLRVTLRGS